MKAEIRSARDFYDHVVEPAYTYFVRAEPKLRDNTLILLCSDNGHERGMGSGGELRGSKGQLYEGGVRSPLIAWWPGGMKRDAAGTSNDGTVITGMDMPPSLLALAGVLLIAFAIFQLRKKDELALDVTAPEAPPSFTAEPAGSTPRMLSPTPCSSCGVASTTLLRSESFPGATASPAAPWPISDVADSAVSGSCRGWSPSPGQPRHPIPPTAGATPTSPRPSHRSPTMIRRCSGSGHGNSSRRGTSLRSSASPSMRPPCV